VDSPHKARRLQAGTDGDDPSDYNDSQHGFHDDGHQQQHNDPAARYDDLDKFHDDLDKLHDDANNYEHDIDERPVNSHGDNRRSARVDDVNCGCRDD
jgi:hypothetical protein